MNFKKHAKPTPAELKILRVLWDEGPITVRDVHETLHGPKGKGYTTTLKQMQVMEQKGLVRRDTSQRSHIYAAVLRQDKVQRDLVDELVNSAFGGSAQKLMVHLVESQASDDMLAQIQALIDEKEQGT